MGRKREIVLFFGATGAPKGQRSSVFDYMTQKRIALESYDGRLYVKSFDGNGRKTELKVAVESFLDKVRVDINSTVKTFPQLVKIIVGAIEDEFSPLVQFWPNASPPLFSDRVIEPDECSFCMIFIHDTLANPWWRSGVEEIKTG